MNKSGTMQSKTLRNEEGYLLQNTVKSSKRTPLLNQENNANG